MNLFNHSIKLYTKLYIKLLRVFCIIVKIVFNQSIYSHDVHNGFIIPIVINQKEIL